MRVGGASPSPIGAWGHRAVAVRIG